MHKCSKEISSTYKVFTEEDLKETKSFICSAFYLALAVMLSSTMVWSSNKNISLQNFKL